jgi:hypothetical protein
MNTHMSSAPVRSAFVSEEKQKKREERREKERKEGKNARKKIIIITVSSFTKNF